MLTTRLATFADAALIATQRVRMFVDSGQAQAEEMAAMAESFAVWVRPRLADGTYLGWLVVEDGAVVAGAGLWLIDFPPHWMDAQPLRAYLLNFFVEPAARGRGIAESMLELTLAEARHRAIAVVSLHASTLGRPIYERHGFVPTNEMMLRLPGFGASLPDQLPE